MRFFEKTNIDFVGFRYKAFIISGIIIAVGLVSMIAKGGLKLGVDFVGGTIVQVRFDEPVPIASMRAVMTRAGYARAEIQEFGEDNEFILRIESMGEAEDASALLGEWLAEAAPDRGWRIVSSREQAPDPARGFDGATLVVVEADSLPELEGLVGDLRGGGRSILDATAETSTRAAFRLPLLGAEAKVADAIKDELASEFPERTIEIRRTETVGPKIGKELANRAWAAIVVSLFGILVYVSWRFEFKFAVGAIMALAHDILITTGIFSLLNKEISLVIVAALLTIVGYSINDTIVVFDRIRENFGLRRRESYEGMVNVSVNETLSRTIITSSTTLLAVLFLLFFGGEVIHDFALAMTIGILTGTYSSIFVASSLVVEWQNRITMRRKAAPAA
jgi:preprotein translocase subunit SecF